MSIVVANAESNSPYFEHYPGLDLNEHVQILDSCESGADESKAIKRAIPIILNTKLPATIPAWKVFVLPLSRKKCFIAFFYSHTLGDGMSGLAFHQSLLTALEKCIMDMELDGSPTTKRIAPAFDTPENLPISWSFFLATLLGIFLPKRFVSILGLRAPSTFVSSGTWTASPVFYNAEKHATGVQTLTIDGVIVAQVLKICRSHGTKLTGLIHQLIVHALSQALCSTPDAEYFAAQTALSLRGALNVSKDEIGNFLSGHMETFRRKKLMSGETKPTVDWAAAKSTTEHLAAASTTPKDQPIGLLRYVSDIRSWTLSKIGEQRDCSYEVSNLTRFQPESTAQKCAVVEMLFCQAANVTGPPLNVNVVSVANGPLTIAVSWQIGALGLAVEEDEESFVNSICHNIELGFEQLASGSKS
ncbi:uncharacterized protein A1O9_01138 [Exophiala aquamarina CBS 119918]|uniref:Alcohol acetyltransferase n=1 Tax=Exophiala aquamarina CBS 119918 TaxID=1182545 RepID=A0A072PTT7_9EURO|nr:uncharacterized protein A1O9_01138 [Exophiala aquamarina CBS 119918]KEF63162.1 hypothetical protein A1O9_01138 [Exophiala aquamarina CBS 119918]